MDMMKRSECEGEIHLLITHTHWDHIQGSILCSGLSPTLEFGFTNQVARIARVFASCQAK